MKKIISVLLAIALLAMTAAAFADTNTDQNRQGRPGGQMPFGQQQPFGQAPNGQAPSGELPGGQAPSGDHNNGQVPNGQTPSGEQPGGRMPFGGKHDGKGPRCGSNFQQGGQAPSGDKPVMIDFDALVKAGVITQDTCEKIKAYMEANKPGDLPGGDAQAPGQDGDKPADPPADDAQAPGQDGDKPADPPADDAQAPGQDGDKPADPPADDAQAPAGGAPAEGGLLKDLLDAGVITQEEYDAITAAQNTPSET